MAWHKNPNKDLKKYYNLFFEIGVIVTLVVFLVAFTVKLPKKQQTTNLVEQQEIVKMEEVEQTTQKEKPPPPPRPQVPVEVPNDEVIQDEPINLNTELDMDTRLELPPPPKEEKKQNGEEDEIFIVVEQQPELIGGLKALQQKIEYPEMARRAGIEGRVYVQFVVDEHGNVQDAEVIRGIGGGCDEEALRVVKQAKFKPGMQRGRPVKVRYSLPIIFKLQR